MKELKLSKAIYSIQGIKETIGAYSGYATMEIHNRGAHWGVMFSACKYDEKLTVKEFENYLIGMENN